MATNNRVVRDEREYGFKSGAVTANLCWNNQCEELDCGMFHPLTMEDIDPAIMRRLRAAKPRIVLTGFCCTEQCVYAGKAHWHDDNVLAAILCDKKVCFGDEGSPFMSMQASTRLALPAPASTRLALSAPLEQQASVELGQDLKRSFRGSTRVPPVFAPADPAFAPAKSTAGSATVSSVDIAAMKQHLASLCANI